MRDVKTYIYIVVASLLLVLYLLAEYNRPKPVSWDATLIDNDKIPFGTYVLYHQLNDIFPDTHVQTYREPVYNVVNDHSIKNAAYIIICNDINLNEYDYKKLTEYIKNGNDVFISASNYSQQFKKSLKVETEPEFNLNKNVEIKLLNRSLDTTYQYVFEKNINNVYFSNLDTTKALVLGKNNFNHCNFIKYPMGKGALYLNTTPFMFSNYSILTKQGASYASIALSYLKKDKVLLWDEFYTQGRDDENNTMRVFMKYAQLKWAFYIACFGLIVFVLYEMKRRQRIIPIIEPLKNSTVDFVNVVGQVYYEQHDNHNIVNKKILYFLEHLYAKYNLRANQLDQLFIDNFAQKTATDHAFATELINYINYLNAAQRVTDTELIKLNQLIEQFYNQSR